MSGFSAGWLALREPLDHAARNAAVATACAAHFSGAAALAVLDLGCGTGSNLRALAPLLPARQDWRLVDRDPALLLAARKALAQWADAAAEAGDGLRLHKDGKTLTVRFEQADLARELPAVLEDTAGLVTATALFDLCSPEWIAQFIRLLALRRTPLLATLTYDGRETWHPPHPADAAMLAAFHSHQRRDKGFGPASGPDAAQVLARALAGLSYRIAQGESPWRIDAGSNLGEALARGSAEAVRETGLVSDATVADWLQSRLAGASCTIGHADLFAW